MSTKARKELSLADIQAREYELLLQFDAYCKRHSLTYCLCGGTLLGAVRHKGFIPWDDDIDLMMPRADYERLRDLSRKEPVSGDLRVLYPGDKGYPYGAMKVVDTRTIVYERNITREEQRTGLALDIFPLDDMYAAGWKNRLLLMRVKFWIQVGKVGAGMIRPERDSLQKRLRNLVMLLLRPVAACTTYEKAMAKVDRIAASAARARAPHRRQPRLAEPLAGHVPRRDVRFLRGSRLRHGQVPLPRGVRYLPYAAVRGVHARPQGRRAGGAQFPRLLEG